MSVDVLIPTSDVVEWLRAQQRAMRLMADLTTNGEDRLLLLEDVGYYEAAITLLQKVEERS
jgi:hypothetical protein